MATARFIDVLQSPDLVHILQGFVQSGTVSGGAFQESTPTLPRVVIIDRRVFCNAASLDLARRPMMLKLFKLFCEARHGRVTREAFLREIYGLEPGTRHSPRFREAMYQNGVKLISRARAEAHAVFGREVGPDFEWMRFDAEDRSWRLLARKTADLAAAEIELQMVNGA